MSSRYSDPRRVWKSGLGAHLLPPLPRDSGESFQEVKFQEPIVIPSITVCQFASETKIYCNRFAQSARPGTYNYNIC